MTRVKGTKSPPLVVVPHRPYVKPLVIVGVVLALSATAVVSYLLGESHGGQTQGRAIAELNELRDDYQGKVAEAEQLSQQVANLTLAREVDQASTEDVRNQVIELKEQIAALEEDIAFYRGLMAPTENQRGLTIGSVEIMATGMPRRFNYKVVVQQLATDHQVLNGTLNFAVVGRQGETIRSIPLRDLSPEVDTQDIKLRFKYFQNIAGQMELPLDFEPERIELQARSIGRNGAEVEKKFSWLVQES